MAVNPIVLSEAKRVQRVLADSITDLHIATKIQDVSTEELPPQLRKSIQLHVRLEEALTEMLCFRRESRLHPPSAQDVQGKLDDVKLSLRHLLRKIRATPQAESMLLHPSVVEMVDDGIDLQIPEDEEEELMEVDVDNLSGQRLDKFVTVVETLARHIEQTLSITAEEAASREEDLKVTIERHRKAGGDLKALQKEFGQEEERRRTEVAERDVLLKKLNDDKKSIIETADSQKNSLEQKHKEREENANKSHEEEFKGLSTAVDKLEMDFQRARAKHSEKEANLRKANLKLYQEVQTWIDKYDKDMEDKTEIMENLNEQIAGDQKRLDFLEEELKKFDEERRIRDEREQKRLDEERRKRDEFIANSEAATKIQACARGLLTRKALKGGGKPKSAKGGKKGAAKKGKQGKKGKKK